VTVLPDLTKLNPVQERRGGDPNQTFQDLKTIIAEAIDNHPRSQQRQLGPSEIGEACTRRLAYKLADIPETRTFKAAWRPTVGTAVHAWLEEAFIIHNGQYRETAGTVRFFIEHRINAGHCAGFDLEGSCDLYDRVTATAIDWKIIGPTAHKKLGTDLRAGRGPRDTYRTQLHTYGLGWTRRNMPVDTVMLVALPAAGELDDALVWHEPFDPTIAQTAMARLDRIHALTTALGLQAALNITNGQLRMVGAAHLTDPTAPADTAALPIDVGSCRFCPYQAPGSTNLATGCPGASNSDAQQSFADSLIAPTTTTTGAPTS
jgi:hypothetical protein